MSIERALIAVDYLGRPIILATDSDEINWFIEENGNNAEEVGLISYEDLLITSDKEKQRGLFLWEGQSKVENVAAPWDYAEPEVVFHGTIRRVEPHEIDVLFQMTPPTILEDRETQQP